MLRNSVDGFSLQKLLGHADLQIIRCHLTQTNDAGLSDLEPAAAAGPAVAEKSLHQDPGAGAVPLPEE